jgi:prophage antirepressor-like protein
MIKKDKIKTFKSSKFGKLRAFALNNELYFIVQDILNALNSDTFKLTVQDIYAFMPEKWKILYSLPNDTGAGYHHHTAVTENGLYLILNCYEESKAALFKKWVINRVIPALHRHCGHPVTVETKELLPDPKLINSLATAANEKEILTKQLGQSIKVIEEELMKIRQFVPIIFY